jgi:hypothetical protein
MELLEEGSITVYDPGIDLDDKFRYPVRPANGNSNDPEFKTRLESMFGFVKILSRFYCC